MESAIQKLIEEELARANAKFGPFSSAHEGYAVILEEVEEAEAALTAIKYNLEYLWKRIKANNERDSGTLVRNLNKCAFNLAAEAIQIGSMANKMDDLLKKRG